MMWKECGALQPELVEMRRKLHRIPELGLQLPQTQAFVTAHLDALGVPYVKSQKDSSLIATIEGAFPGKTVALRADMDALPIQEETGVEYASANGCMHACGHDAHTAMLLGTAKILKAHQSELHGTVRLIFQTAEEIAKGAPVVIENGGLDGVDAIFGTHIGTIIDRSIPAGTMIITPGKSMASFDRFVVKVKGVGCHGSTPEKGIDPVNIAAHVVLGLEAIIAREFNANVPAVLTIGSIHGGSQYNIIPGEVTIEGTTRAFDQAVREKLARRIGEVASACAAAFGGTAELEMDWGAPPVINVPELAALAADAVKEVLGEEKVVTSVPYPNMGGEDFACYLQKVPGVFMFLSSANAEKGTDGPHHNPHFNIDEDVLWEGPAAFVAIVEKYLNS